ncbi:MAG: glucokinase [candidate division Zixibacteria bacterium]|nr:glucokinase [candidate division Zixibacteria bacterium]
MLERLAGFIGGGMVELARVRSENNEMVLYEQSSFVSRDFSNLESILQLYLKKSTTKIDVACFGVAGPVINNEVRTTGLRWLIASQNIESKFSFAKVVLVNDIVATVHGLSHLGSDKFFQINAGKPVSGGNVGLIAAGNGLGEALIFHENGKSYPHASEGGHTDFAPANQTEHKLWEYLYANNGTVEVEDVVSFRGLISIYEFILDDRGATSAEWYENADDKAAAIIEHAISSKDPHAERALSIFIDCYASEAANLALKGMTLGGIYIGGLIAPQIVTALDTAQFMERFRKKGKMESLLADIPIGIIIEEKTPLLGAARLALFS